MNWILENFKIKTKSTIESKIKRGAKLYFFQIKVILLIKINKTTVHKDVPTFAELYERIKFELICNVFFSVP